MEDGKRHFSSEQKLEYSILNFLSQLVRRSTDDRPVPAAHAHTHLGDVVVTVLGPLLLLNTPACPKRASNSFFYYFFPFFFFFFFRLGNDHSSCLSASWSCWPLWIWTGEEILLLLRGPCFVMCLSVRTRICVQCPQSQFLLLLFSLQQSGVVYMCASGPKKKKPAYMMPAKEPIQDQFVLGWK